MKFCTYKLDIDFYIRATETKIFSIMADCWLYKKQVDDKFVILNEVPVYYYVFRLIIKF